MRKNKIREDDSIIIEEINVNESSLKHSGGNLRNEANKENEKKFSFFKNIKIHSDEKSKISKICCTQNYLFVATSSIHSQVHIFNFENIINSLNKQNICLRRNEDKANVQNRSKTNDAGATSKEKNTYENLQYGVEYEVIDYASSNAYANRKSISEAKIRDVVKRDKRHKTIISHRKNKGTDDLYGLKLREEFLYYDNFLGMNKNENEKENSHLKEMIDEQEKQQKLEKEENMNKKKKLEEEALKNEELQKKGYYIYENTIEINIDILKKKNNKIVGNYIEYVGCIFSIASPVVLMKTNELGSLLCILTFDGAIYTYDVTKEALCNFKERRNKNKKMFNHIENVLPMEILQEGKTEKDRKENITEEYMNEEETLQPLSISNSYFISSIKSLDFLPDQKTLICVGMNTDYVFSFINCNNGKKIIYNKKIKIKKDNAYKVPYTLLYDFNCIHLEKEKKKFNGEKGFYAYIGSTCGYLIFFFLSENFLKFINVLIDNENVATNSVFVYKEINCVLNQGLSSEKKKLKEEQIEQEFRKEDNIESFLTGNLDDVYKIKKEELYGLFDNSNVTGNVTGNVNLINNENSTSNNSKSPCWFSQSKNIFKNVSQHFFSYAFLISKNVQINYILSIDKPEFQKKEEKKNTLILGLNDGRVILYNFQISNFFKNEETFFGPSDYTVEYIFNKKKEFINKMDTFRTKDNSNIPSSSASASSSSSFDTPSKEKTVENKKKQNSLYNSIVNENAEGRIEPKFTRDFIKTLDKSTYDFTGLHHSSTIKTINIYKQKNYILFKELKSEEKEEREEKEEEEQRQQHEEKHLVLINVNVKKISEESDKNLYTTYIINVHNKQIEVLYQHVSQLLDSDLSMVSSLYFCLNDNNTISVFTDSIISIGSQ